VVAGRYSCYLASSTPIISIPAKESCKALLRTYV